MRFQSFKLALALAASLSCFGAIAAEPPLPRSGTYAFKYRDAEFPSQIGVELKVTIRGRAVEVVAKAPWPSHGIPKGAKIDSGLLLWHATSKQWIIGETLADRNAESAGDCGGGPAVLDFKHRDYWTC